MQGVPHPYIPADHISSQPLDFTADADAESYELPTGEMPQGAGMSGSTTGAKLNKFDSFTTAVEPTDGEEGSSVGNVAADFLESAM